MSEQPRNHREGGVDSNVFRYELAYSFPFLDI